MKYGEKISDAVIVRIRRQWERELYSLFPHTKTQTQHIADMAQKENLSYSTVYWMTAGYDRILAAEAIVDRVRIVADKGQRS